MAQWSHDVTQSPLRMFVAGMSDAALVAAASRGLLRRALADVGAGKVRVKSEQAGSAEIIADGESVYLSADGLAKSACSCPAPETCRHRIAAILHLREIGPAHDHPAGSTPVDWNGILEAFAPAQIAHFAGKSAWQTIVARKAPRAEFVRD